MLFSTKKLKPSMMSCYMIFISIQFKVYKYKSSGKSIIIIPFLQPLFKVGCFHQNTVSLCSFLPVCLCLNHISATLSFRKSECRPICIPLKSIRFIYILIKRHSRLYEGSSSNFKITRSSSMSNLKRIVDAGFSYA